MEEEEVRLVDIGVYTFRLLKRPNGTYRSEPLPSPLLGSPLIPKERKVLGIFDSSSNPGDKHYVIQSPTGEVYCTCIGFRAPNKCWHYRGMMEVLKTTPICKIIDPIRINLESGRISSTT